MLSIRASTYKTSIIKWQNRRCVAKGPKRHVDIQNIVVMHASENIRTRHASTSVPAYCQVYEIFIISLLVLLVLEWARNIYYVPSIFIQYMYNSLLFPSQSARSHNLPYKYKYIYMLVSMDKNSKRGEMLLQRPADGFDE